MHLCARLVANKERLWKSQLLLNIMAKDRLPIVQKLFFFSENYRIILYYSTLISSREFTSNISILLMLWQEWIVLISAPWNDVVIIWSVWKWWANAFLLCTWCCFVSLYGISSWITYCMKFSMQVYFPICFDIFR